MTLTVEQFDDFLCELYGHAPFPWQSMLVRRIAEAGWPRGIDLPTASGKTACLDIGVYTLALSLNNEQARPAPRRIFFVVDRRIVVDEAHRRAEKLAAALAASVDRDSVAGEVARRLADLAGTKCPLLVSRMRAGIVREDYWVNNPAQPAVITSTVDQVGSRLLFRGYGPGQLSQSIHAALAACDSLILLDEAHCAVPFMQTADAVRRYCGEDWMDSEASSCILTRPLTVVVLSATLPPSIQQAERFPRDDTERNQALDHPELRRRIETKKLAWLEVAKKPGSRDWTLGKAVADDWLVLHAAQRAADLATKSGRRRIGVMVNRVATAASIYQQLKSATHLKEHALDANVVLMTGRMRPVDRDKLVSEWSPVLKVNAERDPDRPVIVVSTQCLEVGADFSFDALVTECASLDALRQRFGRLNRLGTPDLPTDAVILIGQKPKAKSLTQSELEKLADDPIYGKALEATWLWLNQIADSAGDIPTIDMSTARIRRLLAEQPPQCSLEDLLAPSPIAPVLLPAYVDFLCQTSPNPEPDPDVALFLHGPNRGVPDARLVFRADLVWDAHENEETNRRKWLDTVSLVPPVSAEALSVPLPRLRRWLAGQTEAADDPTGDVEGQLAEADSDQRFAADRFVIWRGRKRSVVSPDPWSIYQDETVVVPADPERASELGHYFTRPDESAPLDMAEQAWPQARGRPVLRVNRHVLGRWDKIEPVASLIKWAEDEDRNPGDLADYVDQLLHYEPEEGEPALPGWLRQAAAECRESKHLEHPAGGGVLFGPVRPKDREALLLVADEEPFDDEDDTTSASDDTVSLADHTQNVVKAIRSCVEERARLVSKDLADDMVLAAKLHDLGKADERFQIYLRGRYPKPTEARQPIAKSDGIPRTRSRMRRIRELAELPEDFRHEMLSVQLAQMLDQLASVAADRQDLILHLIASHHGYGRPFAPVCTDDNPPDVAVSLDGISASLTAQQRRQFIPPHRLDSGVAERFWRLTRRYGWWGLAWLEAILRLADRYASARERANANRATRQEASQEGVNV